MNWHFLAAGLMCSTLLAGTAYAGEPLRSSSTEAAAAPVFTVAADSGQLNLEDYKGKIVLLDFWASWCAPCRQSFKWLNQMQERYSSDGLVVLAVNVDENKGLAQQFLKSNPANFLIGYDPAGKIAETYRLKGMPSSYLIDRDGKLRIAHTGFREKDKSPMQAQIQALLGEPAAPSLANTAEQLPN